MEQAPSPAPRRCRGSSHRYDPILDLVARPEPVPGRRSRSAPGTSRRATHAPRIRSYRPRARHARARSVTSSGSIGPSSVHDGTAHDGSSTMRALRSSRSRVLCLVRRAESFPRSHPWSPPSRSSAISRRGSGQSRRDTRSSPSARRTHRRTSDRATACRWHERRVHGDTPYRKKRWMSFPCVRLLPSEKTFTPSSRIARMMAVVVTARRRGVVLKYFLPPFDR